MSSIKGMIPFNSYEKLLGSEYEDGKLKVIEVPIKSLHTFENHPFHVNDDEEMQELVDSIKEKGVVSPAIVRERKAGGYEIISGHRRKRACEIAGLMTMPVIIKELSDKEATILMVDANIQRENVLPSERAHAYKMRMDAEGKQGERSDLTSDQVGPKLTSSIIGEESGISGTQVKRYIRLNHLLPKLLERVDEKTIGFIPAVELSFLKENEQDWVLSVLEETGRKISLKQAEKLHKFSSEKTLTEDVVLQTITGKVTIKRMVYFSDKELRYFFPDDMDSDQIKKQMVDLLKQWKTRESIRFIDS